MPRYIVKMERGGLSRYMEWSTIVDAPITRVMSLEEFKQHHQEEYGRRGVAYFDDRMARVEKTGTSAYGDDLEDLWRCNRAGDKESHLTKDEIWAKYHDERPKGMEED